jgi:hypothetical protein
MHADQSLDDGRCTLRSQDLLCAGVLEPAGAVRVGPQRWTLLACLLDFVGAWAALQLWASWSLRRPNVGELAIRGVFVSRSQGRVGRIP